MKMDLKKGFTLVEVIVSMLILALVVTGFAFVFTGNVRIVSSQYRVDRHYHALFKTVENQTGKPTGRWHVLTFEADELGLVMDFDLHEYHATSGANLTYHENYDLYYFDSK